LPGEKNGKRAKGEERNPLVYLASAKREKRIAGRFKIRPEEITPDHSEDEN
jgi:hypothetical protein